MALELLFWPSVYKVEKSLICLPLSFYVTMDLDVNVFESYHQFYTHMMCFSYDFCFSQGFDLLKCVERDEDSAYRFFTTLSSDVLKAMSSVPDSL